MIVHKALLWEHFFFFPWPGIQSHPFRAGPGEPLTPRPTITHHPPLPSLPCPAATIPIKGLACSVDRWRGKCDFEGKKKWEKEKKCKKPLKCKGTEKSSESKCWWNRAITDQTKSQFHLIIHRVWSTAQWAEKVEDLLSENEVLRSLLAIEYVLDPSLYIFSARNKKKGFWYLRWQKEEAWVGGKEGLESDEVDGEDERCVVEGDSIRGVKANRAEQRGHRCAACSPDYRQAAAQTALSAWRCIPFSCVPCRTLSLSLSPSFSLTGPLHPPGSAKARWEKNKMANLCFEVPHIDNDTLQHREKMWGAFF